MGAGDTGNATHRWRSRRQEGRGPGRRRYIILGVLNLLGREGRNPAPVG